MTAVWQSQWRGRFTQQFCGCKKINEIRGDFILNTLRCPRHDDLHVAIYEYLAK